MALILNGTTGISGVDGSAATPAFKGNDSNTGVSFGTDTVTINTGGVARVTTDASGNVGVGTVSPSSVSGYTALNIKSTLGSELQLGNTAGTAQATLWCDANGITYTNYAATSHIWVTAASEKMRLDSSGNLGLGVTPSYQLDIQRSSVDTTINVQATTANQSSRVRLVGKNGSTDNEWNIVAAGAFLAGSQLRFTQGVWTNNPAMMIDSNSNVGIGTASPSAKLTVTSGESRVDLVATNASGRNWNLYSGGGGNVGAGVFAIAEGGATQRFLIVGGGAGESARIDSSGNLLVGTTSDSGARLRVNFSGVSTGVRIGTTATSGTAVQFVYEPATQVGTITTTTTATAYNTSSDYRLKENVASMTGALATVAQLKPCTYTWKSSGEAGQGFIAHELQAVMPDCVTGTKDAVDKDGKPQYQGVDTSFLVATLVSAIQELKAEVDSLKAQLQGAA